MSDEELKDVPLEEFIAENIDKPEEAEENNEPDYLAEIPEEDRKYAKGWNPNFKGESAKSLKQFISDGKMMAKVDYLSKRDKEREDEFKQRLADVNKLYKLQIIQKEKALQEAESRFRDAVNMSDMDEVKAAQKEIDEINAIDLKDPEAKQEEPGKLSAEEKEIADTWDANNQWINESNPDHPNYDPTSVNFAKAAFANQLIAKLVQQKKPIREIIETIEEEVGRRFAEDVKPKAPKHIQSNVVQRTQRKGGGSWNDLTAQEKNMYEGMESSWPSKDAFIQAALDARGN